MPTSWHGHPSHTLNWCSNPFFQNYLKSLEKKFKWKYIPLRIEISVPRAVRKQVVRRDHVADRGLVVHSVELWKNRTLKTTNKDAVGGLVSRSMTWWGVPSVKHFNKRSVRGRLLNETHKTKRSPNSIRHQMDTRSENLKLKFFKEKIFQYWNQNFFLRKFEIEVRLLIQIF